MENSILFCIGCNQYIFNDDYFDLLIDENYIEIKYEKNRVITSRMIFLFGYNNRVNITNFEKWINDPYERHYNNLNFSLKEFSKEIKFSNCTYTLRNCLENIYDNYFVNPHEHNICGNCVTLLKVTGCLIMKTIENCSEYVCGRDEYFCCIRCEKPKIDDYQNIHHLKINSENKKYIISNLYEYTYYEDDDIANKYTIFYGHIHYNFMICKTCFDKIADYKLNTRYYYYDNWSNVDKLICNSCNLIQQFPLNESDKKFHHSMFVEEYIKILNDENFYYVITYINGKYKLVNSDNELVNLYPHYHDYSCSNICAFNLIINYLNNNLQFLLNFLPKDLSGLILEYYVLYFNVCNKCVFDKIKSKELQEDESSKHMYPTINLHDYFVKRYAKKK